MSEGSERQTLVLFRLGESEFGVPVSQVLRVLRIQPCTRVPNAPSFLEGVLNVEGWVVPVVDLKKRLSLSTGEEGHGDRARILLVEVGEERVGMIVDAVTELLNVDTGAIAPPPAMIAQINGVYLTGVIQREERVIILLDLRRVLTLEELVELDRLIQEEENDGV